MRGSMSPISFRLISLGNDFYNLTLRLNGNVEMVTAEWRDILIADSPPPISKDVASSHRCFPLHSIEPAPPFRLPHWLVGRLMQMGLELQPLEMRSLPIAGKPLLAVARFEDRVAVEGIHIVLGTCHLQSSRGMPTYWAKALVVYERTWDEERDYSHSCYKHHIADWMGETKDFGEDERTVRLSFSRCKLTPGDTFVTNVELIGGVYDAIKKRKNIPSHTLAPAPVVPEARPATVSPPPLKPTRTRNLMRDSIARILKPISRVFAVNPRHGPHGSETDSPRLWC